MTGRLTLRATERGSYETVQHGTNPLTDRALQDDVMQLVFCDGTLLVDDTLAAIRVRAAIKDPSLV